MRILVTGGSGFIGRALCAELLARGHALLVWTRDVAAARQRLPAAAQPIATLDEARGVEGIVNLAGENVMEARWTSARKALLRESRIGLTQRLVEWIAAQPQRPRVLVSGSAIGWYGDCGDTPVDEDAPCAGDFAAQLCADWEATAQTAEPLGLRVCRVRIGVVLDGDGGALQQMLPPFRLGLGGPIGHGRQWLSWIHRADLVALLAELLVNEAAQGVYNGTAPDAARSADFARALGRALHRPAVIPTPAVALKLALGERASMLTGGQRVLPRRTQALGYTYRHGKLDAALQAALG